MRLAILERIKTADTGVKLKLPPSTLNTCADSNMLLMQITHPIREKLTTLGVTPIENKF